MTKSINNNPTQPLINYLTFSSDKPKTTQRIIGSTSDTYTRQLLVEFDDEVHIGIAYFEEHENHYTRTNRNKQLLIRRFEACRDKNYEVLYGNQRPPRPTLSDYKRLVNSHVSMSLLDSLVKPNHQDHFIGDLAVISYRLKEVDNSAKSLALYRERDIRSFEWLTESVTHQMEGLAAGYLNK